MTSRHYDVTPPSAGLPILSDTDDLWIATEQEARGYSDSPVAVAKFVHRIQQLQLLSRRPVLAEQTFILRRTTTVRHC